MTTTCYDASGNFYYGIPSTGFCGSNNADCTFCYADVTCPACTRIVTELRS